MVVVKLTKPTSQPTTQPTSKITCLFKFKLEEEEKSTKSRESEKVN
jgi:hypothetical protein